jgi:hypothetical protein
MMKRSIAAAVAHGMVEFAIVKVSMLSASQLNVRKNKKL